MEGKKLRIKDINNVFLYTDVCSIQYEYVFQEEIKLLVKSISRIRKMLQKDEIQDNLCIDVFQQIRAYMFEVISCLVNYNELVLDIDSIKRQVIRISKIYPVIGNEYIVATKLLIQLNINDTNVLFSRLISKLRENRGKRIAIISKNRLSLCDKEMVNGLLLKNKISFYKDNTFRKVEENYDMTIFLGSERAFGNYANNCPKSKQIIFLGYEAFNNQYNYRGILNELPEVYSTIPEVISINIDKDNREIEELYQPTIVNEEAINRYIKLINQYETQGRRETKVVNAKIFFLEDDRGILLDIDKKYECFNTEINKELEQKNAREIEVDEYIILNNKSQPQLIVDIASQYLGEQAESQQKYINSWKERLSYLINTSGLEETIKLLKSKGISTANQVNVKNWISEFFILPDDKKILDVLGFTVPQKDKIISSEVVIKSSRIRAGKYIFACLREKVKSLNLEELIEGGYQTFEVEELKGASFNIEHVVGIGKTNYQVPITKVGQVFKMKGLEG